MFDSHKYAAMIADKIGETLPPERELVGRVRKDGGKSGEGKQKASNNTLIRCGRRL
jgi:hypothetical protein